MQKNFQTIWVVKHGKAGKVNRVSSHGDLYIQFRIAENLIFTWHFSVDMIKAKRANTVALRPFCFGNRTFFHMKLKLLLIPPSIKERKPSRLKQKKNGQDFKLSVAQFHYESPKASTRRFNDS